MTTIVELYGGPGTGKSTTAAGVFAALKGSGVNAELVGEYAKEWAWQGRKIGVLDQLYVMSKQLHREARLLDKVDVIVTDSPVRLAHYYVHKYGTEATKTAAEALVDAYEAEAEVQGHRRISVMLERVKPFNPKGRFENEEQANTIDSELREMLTSYGYHNAKADTSGRDRILELVQAWL
jgi:hypothetical protein